MILNLDLILSLQFKNWYATDKLFVTMVSTLDLIWHVLCQIFLCHNKNWVQSCKSFIECTLRNKLYLASQQKTQHFIAQSYSSIIWYTMKANTKLQLFNLVVVHTFSPKRIFWKATKTQWNGWMPTWKHGVDRYCL